jgi:allantoinase
MAGFDLKLVNGQLVTSAGVSAVDVGIRDGSIAAIGDWGSLVDAEEVVDLTGRVILPGGIDTHVHGGDPGAFDFGEVSRAAALGGVTTIVDMPIQIPNTTDAESFDAKLGVVAPKAHVDFALWATLAPGGAGAIPELKERGAVGIKLVMQRSVEGVMPLHGDGELVEAFAELQAADLPAAIHAESQDMIAHLEEKLKREGRNDPRAFLDCHPPITELEAIHRALFLARRAGARIHIAHCSIGEGVDMIDEARRSGQAVSVETCPHYLVLDDSIFDSRGVFAKLSPALRDRGEVEALWQRLREGKVDSLASDHVPYPLPFKELGIWEAAAGAPGIQTMFPLVLKEGVKKNRITLPQLARLMSEGPARVAGLYPKKGSASIGADADFAIFDLDRERPVMVEDQIGVEWTLYEGMQAIYPERVLVRGRSVVLDGAVVGKAGEGEFCVPERAASEDWS